MSILYIGRRIQIMLKRVWKSGFHAKPAQVLYQYCPETWRVNLGYVEGHEEQGKKQVIASLWPLNHTVLGSVRDSEAFLVANWLLNWRGKGSKWVMVYWQALILGKKVPKFVVFPGFCGVNHPSMTISSYQ